MWIPQWERRWFSSHISKSWDFDTMYWKRIKNYFDSKFPNWFILRYAVRKFCLLIILFPTKLNMPIWVNANASAFSFLWFGFFSHFKLKSFWLFFFLYFCLFFSFYFNTSYLVCNVVCVAREKVSLNGCLKVV